MDTESPITNEPAPEGPSRRRSALTGAVLGIVALTASVVGVSAIAGAQDDPATDPAAAADLDILLDADDLDDADDIEDLDDGDWQPFDECIEGEIGDLDVDVDVDESALTEEEWEALDDQFEAAEEACRDLLPADALVELEAFEAFDQCLTDAGFDEAAFDDGPVVFIETGDGEQIIEFGEATGTVTITGDASGVTVATEGVTMIDEGEIDAAFATCEQLLPEDALDDWDDDEHDDWDDEDDA